jgi:hypothetical protein
VGLRAFTEKFVSAACGRNRRLGRLLRGVRTDVVGGEIFSGRCAVLFGRVAGRLSKRSEWTRPVLLARRSIYASGGAGVVDEKEFDAFGKMPVTPKPFLRDSSVVPEC